MEFNLLKDYPKSNTVNERKKSMSNCAIKLADLTEKTLTEQVKERDPAAFTELVRRASQFSYRQAMLILRNREDAEDELQNSYLNAWRHIDQFRAHVKFSSWLSIIVKNQCLMRLRKLRRGGFIYLDDRNEETGHQPPAVAEHGPSPEELFYCGQKSALVKREIRGLPFRFREVLQLCDLEGLSTAEAARQICITLPALKSRLARARYELERRIDLIVNPLAILPESPSRVFNYWRHSS